MRADQELRADARRNRDAILRAARTVFASRGYLAPLAEVAAAADVGRATLQRRFPTREDLIVALIDENLRRLEALAASLEDEDDALFRILAETAEVIAEGNAFVDYFYRPEAPFAHRRHFAARVIEITTPALQRGQRAGLIRGDITSEDLVIISEMLVAPLAHRSPLDTGASTVTARALALVIRSIRSADA